MLKSPSTRRKRDRNEIIPINLVPMLDAMVTLIAFLMFTMSFLTIVSIESPIPLVSSKNVNEKLKKKPLQLTVSIRTGEVEIWSAFGRIKPKTFKNLEENQPDVVGIHEHLLQVKQQFPNERKVVIAPVGGTSYDNLVAIMDAVRVIEENDPPLYVQNQETGVDEVVTALFPEVVFGNLLGDT